MCLNCNQSLRPREVVCFRFLAKIYSRSEPVSRFIFIFLFFYFFFFFFFLLSFLVSRLSVEFIPDLFYLSVNKGINMLDINVT